MVLVSRPGDQHGDEVQNQLEVRGARVQRISLNLWPTLRIHWSPGGVLHLLEEVEEGAVVWWRRPGWIDTAEFDAEEADLVRAEAVALLFGLLASQRPRWVDDPTIVVRAESKPLQLATALALGVRIPRSVVTSDETVARRLLDDLPLVAKSVSSGRGLAPFVDRVDVDLLRLVPGTPVLLQELIAARADIRLITIGEGTLAWRRERHEADHVDWRASDPGGREFVPIPVPARLARQAQSVSKALRLSFSVQDWLATADEYFFLEVNPQGQWLFLAEADSLVTGLLVDHLLDVAHREVEGVRRADIALDARTAVLGEVMWSIQIEEGKPRDQGSGIRDQGSGIRDQGSGIRDQGSGIRDQGSGIRDQGSGEGRACERRCCAAAISR